MEFLNFFIRVEQTKATSLENLKKRNDSYDRMQFSVLHDELCIMSSNKDVLKIH